jgi:hypothetical protein
MLEGATGSVSPTATKVAHGGRLIYTLVAFPAISLCCVDDQTILFGGVDVLKSVLDKNGVAESTSRFAFLDKPRQFAIVVAPRDPEAPAGYLGAETLDVFNKTAMAGMSFCFDLDSVLHGAVLVNARSAKDAREAKLQVERDMQNFLRSPAIAVGLNPEVQKGLLAAKTNVSGRLLSVTADLPAGAVVEALTQGSGFEPPASPPIESSAGATAENLPPAATAQTPPAQVAPPEAAPQPMAPAAAASQPSLPSPAASPPRGRRPTVF